jgi:hypothetical protein
MPTEIGKEWTQIFAYDLQTVGPREHAHKLGECSENCVMAREVKCVCRCGGKNHGAANRQGMPKLDKLLDLDGLDVFPAEPPTPEELAIW